MGRRALLLAMVVLVLCGCGRAAAPSVAPRLGHLAYVVHGTLDILDLGTGKVVQVGVGRAAAPAWSHDGRWVAVLGDVHAKTGEGTVWIAAAGGTNAQQVQGVPGPVAPGGFAWSPASDMLAVAPATSGLWLVSQGAHLLAAGGRRVWSLAWSPDGRSLAYVVTEPATDPVKRSDALYTVAARGGTPRLRYLARGAGIELAAWVPGGLLFWVDPLHSASLAADGLSLVELAGRRILATTLVRRNWLSFSPSGRRVLLTAGGGRSPSQGKALAICDLAAARCRTLAQPRGSVSLDPSWSPGGRRMAFVRAGVQTGPVTSSAVARAWDATRTLWLAAGDGSGAHAVTAAGTGVSAPQWSPDGKQVYYLRDGALWAYDVGTGKVSQVASGGVSSFALAR